MRSRLPDIHNKIKSLADTFVSNVLRELGGIAAVDSAAPSPACGISPKTPLPLKRRTRTELRLLIESAVSTYGADTTDKFIAVYAGISVPMIYKEPYSTFLNEARKEYKRQQAAERSSEWHRNK
ncbi:MAG: hypothetical protein LBT46_09665 [Planctomycetaceae bacterium]|jgi:hypothetical protein|nr:hypothetical protein [Planctomycetaceae bacterium]